MQMKVITAVTILHQPHLMLRLALPGLLPLEESNPNPSLPAAFQPAELINTEEETWWNVYQLKQTNASLHMYKVLMKTGFCEGSSYRQAEARAG